MTIQQKINDLENAFGRKLPQFYVDFLIKHQLEESHLFSDLTLIYGTDDLAERQYETQQYLPSHLKIGDDSGDYGIFINCRPYADDHIYITGMGDLDETSLEMLAENFDDWAAKDYDTEQILQTIYESKVASPLLQLEQKIANINQQIKDLNKKRNSGELDLKSFILQKRALETQLESLNTQQANLYEKVTAQQKTSLSLNATEQQFDVVLPSLFKKLEADGMLDYARNFGPDWYKNEFATLKSSPPFLLFAQNVELLSTRDIYQDMCALRDGEFWDCDNWLPDFKMIPFAGDGSGDKYAFWLSCHTAPANAGDWPIIHWWHDDNKCTILANNLQDFMFKSMLDCALEIDTEYDSIADGDIKTNLQNWLKTHQKYLKPSQVALLTDIYARDLQQDTDDNFYLMTVEEYKTIMQNELGIFGKIGKWGFESDLASFKYAQD